MFYLAFRCALQTITTMRQTEFRLQYQDDLKQKFNECQLLLV